ncbi:MAG TPA: hypothetical protein VKV21_03065 [Solirubrobacteraceae bacterium]|nr:hypothetical protein [Solirubrobacteraceae bacterium]
MVHADAEGWTWRLGKLQAAGGGVVDLRQWRSVSDAEADQLKTSSQLVRTLGSQRDFQSLVAVAERWIDSLERIRDRLAAQRPLPAALVTAASLDLVALGHAAGRSERGVTTAAESVRAAGYGTVEQEEVIETSRRFLQTRPAFLACSALVPDARAGKVAFELDGEVVHIAGVAAFSAEDFARALIGEVGGFMVASVGVFAEAISDPIRRLEALLNDVPAGVVPDLVRLRGEEHIAGAEFVALAISQAVALRRFAESLETLTADQFAQALFAVMNASARQQVGFGAVNVTGASVHARTTSAMDQLPHAELTFDLDLLGSAPVDFWSAVTFDMFDRDAGQRLFTGAVQDASGKAALNLDCEGGIELVEHNRSSIAVAGVETAELITTMMRQTGLSEDTIALSSPDWSARPVEQFEVFVPLRGVAVETPVRVGRVTLVPVADGHKPLAALDLDADGVASLATEYRDASAYAVAEVEADGLDVAEELGYAEIETAIAWLVARQRYGFLRLPDGTARTFSRIEALQSLRHGPVVQVRGQTTGRQWLRWVHDVAQPVTRELTVESDLLKPAMPKSLGTRDERALRGLMRAVNETSVQQQVQALAEALENYVAGVKIPGSFSDIQLTELRELAPTWLSEDQRRKFINAINGLNGSPFQRRLAQRLEDDGVPLTADERTLLFETLRRARNDVAHGRKIKKSPTREQVLRGISIVARALMFSVAQTQARLADDLKEAPS